MQFNVACLRASLFALILLLLGWLSCSVLAIADNAALQPETATGWDTKQGWLYQKQAVAAANPLAAKAGAEILRAGGSAVDAAIATQLVLGLVEPQSSGLGGGGFLLSWHQGELIAWDGRETAPALILEKQFFGDSPNAETAHLLSQLEAKGYQLQFNDLTSGIQMLLRTPKGVLGGADSRREGVVLGR